MGSEAARADQLTGRRGVWIAVWIVVAVAAIIAAFLLGQRVKSPWDRAIANADTDPVVLATVSTRDVTAGELNLNGEVQLGTAKTLSPTVTGSSAVVTRVGVAKGEKVHPGDFVAEVSGVPVLAVNLPFPLYRDLKPGDFGTDVQALQEFLSSLDLLGPANIDGKYGVSTSDAVTSLYERADETPPPPAVPQGEEDVGANPEDVNASTGTPLLRAATVIAPKGGGLVVAAPEVGDSIGDSVPLLTVQTGKPTIAVRVPADSSVERGEVFIVTSTRDSSTTTTATVTKVSEFTPGEGGEGPGFDVRLQLTEPNGFSEGEVAVVTAEDAETVSSGLTVPLTALRDGSDGTYVMRVQGASRDQGFESVVVTLGDQGDGYVIVIGSELSEGDKVVVSQ